MIFEIQKSHIKYGTHNDRGESYWLVVRHTPNLVMGSNLNKYTGEVYQVDYGSIEDKNKCKTKTRREAIQVLKKWFGNDITIKEA